LSYRVHIGYGKTRMAGLQSDEGRMMIDSVVWAQHINVTDTQTHSHVATANAMPRHRVGRQSVFCSPRADAYSALDVSYKFLLKHYATGSSAAIGRTQHLVLSVRPISTDDPVPCCSLLRGGAVRKRLKGSRSCSGVPKGVAFDGNE